jgi:hypothetical protein
MKGMGRWEEGRKKKEEKTSHFIFMVAIDGLRPCKVNKATNAAATVDVCPDDIIGHVPRRHH